MLNFTVGDMSPTALVDGCIKCCCESMSLKPGTISKVNVVYAPWAVPIGRLHCIPQFNLEQMQTCPVPTGSNLPPRPAAKVAFDTPTNTVLIGDLNTQVMDLEGDPLSYKQLFMWGPNYGALKLDADGTFTYTPGPNFTGIDRFFASVSDGINASVVFEVIIGVGTPSLNAVNTPHVSVLTEGVQVNERYFTVSFPVKVSPAAQLCEVWRLTVLQGALDCEAMCFTRTDCFDIRIVKC